MGSETKIGWAHHTFNAWRGCTRVSPGCAKCYAAVLAKRNPKTLGTWGKDGTRIVGVESYWKQPYRWNRDAEAAGERQRVFCLSLGDVFEDWNGPMIWPNGKRVFLSSWDDDWQEDDNSLPATMVHVRARLFQVIDETPWLDWLLLTKRPENVSRLMPASLPGLLGGWPGRKNVWLGTSIENQAVAQPRLNALRSCRGLASVLFVSYEPLLEQVRVDDHFYDWAIFGGETGPGHREMSLYALESGVHSCLRAAKPAVFVKQDSGPYPERQGRISDELWQRKEFPGSVVG